MRALTAGALLVLAVAACGSAQKAGSSPPGGASARPCSASPSPSGPPSEPATGESSGFSVVISQGQTIKRQATVLPRQLLLAVQVAWNNGDVQLTLISPSGKVYDRGTTDPAAHHHVQSNGESFAIDKPESGQWALQLFGATIGAPVETVGVSTTQLPLSALAPIATLSASTDRGVAPLTVQFTGQADGFLGATISSYSWDFGDCSPRGNAPEVSHVFTAAGSYTVTFTAVDSNGEPDSATSEVLVTAYDHAPSAAFVWGTLDATKPTQITFDAGGSKDVDGQITGYAWDFGDGSTGSQTIPMHSYAEPGTYKVKLTVTDNGGLTGSTCQLVTTGQWDLGSPRPCLG